MPLAAGTRLGPYEVLSLIGSGGMGEVYRAHDAKLGRDVALKVLPAAFATDPDRLARFEREAKVLAALSHPYIGHIYGFEDSGAVQALVLELIGGPTLADRIAEGPIPLAEGLRIAKQIAEALDVAHEQGIVHRDLKPANIKLTPEGTVKVLDFGLAKAAAADSTVHDLTHSPTVAVAGTRGGVVLGTAAYMSPEQARGHLVDKRADIWAFGCVLLEILTGRAVFKGDTASDTLAAILRGDPDWTTLPPATPPGVRLLLQRCLEKDPKHRLRDIGDARIELEHLENRSGELAPASDATPSPSARATPRARWPTLLVAAAVVVVALVLLGAGVERFRSATPTLPVTSPAEYVQLTDFPEPAVAPSLSPDGRMVTFIRGGESFLSSGQIYVKLLPAGESVRLTSDSGRKYAPAFTPDGSRISYTVLGVNGTAFSWDTFVVPVLGGEPARLLPNASGLSWIDDRHVLFAEVKGHELHMGIVTATTSRAESHEIYFPPAERAMAHYAYASPDQRSVLVVEMDQSHAFHQPCRLLPFDGRSAGRQVGPPGTCTSAAWSPDGRWMYFGARVNGSSHLWRQSFPDGTPEQITSGPTEEEGVSVAPDGRSLVSSVGTRRSTIWIHDGTKERPISSEGYALSPQLSHDGTRVFYLVARDLMLSAAGWEPSAAELHTFDLRSGKSNTVLPGLSITDYDISSDDREVAFTTTDGASGESTIWLAALDHDTPPRKIAGAGDHVSFGAGELIFRSLAENNVLVRIRKDGTGRERISGAPVLDKFGVSPDGEWAIVYSPVTGNATLTGTIAVPIHGGTPRKICGIGDCRATWSSDGRFFFVSNYVTNTRSASSLDNEKTLAIPVPPGKSLPDFTGLTSALSTPPAGAFVLEHEVLSPGKGPTTYVFTRTDLQRNLFRIPLH